MYNPKYTEVILRLSAINGSRVTNDYFYCSHGCKLSCSIYNKRDAGYIRDYLISIGEEHRQRVRKSGETYAINTAKKRDGYKCACCESECDLEGHHIIPYKMLIGTPNKYLIEDTDNIKTVCRWCHMNVKHIGDLSIKELIKIDNRDSICSINTKRELQKGIPARKQ